MRRLWLVLLPLVMGGPLVAQSTSHSPKDTTVAVDSGPLSKLSPDSLFKLACAALAKKKPSDSDSVFKARLDRFKKLYRTTAVASGEVQSALGGKSTSAPVTGSLGISHDTPKEHFSALIAVAANGDTLHSPNQRDFASSVLSQGLTGVGKGSGVLLDYTRYFGHDICYPPIKLQADSDSSSDWNDEYNKTRASYRRVAAAFARCQSLLEAKAGNGLALNNRIGARGYMSISKSTWRSADTSRTAPQPSDLALFAFGLHVVWIPLNHPLDTKGNSFLFKAEGGFAARSILGDLADSSEALVRNSYLGTEGKWFTGLELEPSLQVNKVTAFSVITWLHNSHHDDDVKGLTGLQVVLGFSFEAPLFTF